MSIDVTTWGWDIFVFSVSEGGERCLDLPERLNV